MTTRKPFHQIFEFGSAEQSELDSTGPSSQHPVPSLDERASIYLRAVDGSHDFAGEEFARARLRIQDAMAEQIASEVPARVRVSNEWVPARPHSARRWGMKAIAACAFVALVGAAGLISHGQLSEKWFATDPRVALAPLTTQDTKTNLELSSPSRMPHTDPRVALEPLTAQDTKTNLGLSSPSRVLPTDRFELQDKATEQSRNVVVVRPRPVPRLEEPLERVKALILAGDLPAARLVLASAAEAGNARAALVLGRTYDPSLVDPLSSLSAPIAVTKIESRRAAEKQTGFDPDIKLARFWYQKAQELGLTEAADHLRQLDARPGPR